MKFQSSVYTAVSGSIGGITYGHNKGGMYARGRGTPINPNSTRQQATRAVFAMFASNWSAILTQAQRDLWNAYAQTHTIEGPFGEQIYINGISWFIMFNTRLQDSGLAVLTAPPPGTDPNAFTTFSCDISAINTVDVTFTDAPPTGGVIQLWQTLPGTTGQTPNFRQARLVAYSAVDQASPWAATMPFGTASGEQVTFYGRKMNTDGQVGGMSVHTDLADY